MQLTILDPGPPPVMLQPLSVFYQESLPVKVRKMLFCLLIG